MVAVQTPQAFLAAPLLAAYRQAAADGFVGTDTASCIERYTDLPVRCVPGDAGNIKITFPDDLFLAERLLAKADWDLSGGRESTAAAPHLRDVLPHGRRRMTDIEHADLRCESCGEVTEHELQVRRPAAGVDAVHQLRAPHRAHPAPLVPAYVRDLEQRVVSKPRRMLRRASRDPLGFARQLPGAVLRQPAKFWPGVPALFRR